MSRKERNRSAVYAWRQRNPEYNKWQKKLQRYGVTKETFDLMYTVQQGKCAVCKESKADNVDHDHQTGRVRGLLCAHCNTMLGYAKDNPSILNAGADYLKGK